MPDYCFKDRLDRNWDLTLTISDVRRVAAETDVDLKDAGNGQLINELAADPVKFADVLFAIVKPQAEKANVDEQTFGEGLAGDAIDNATTAFLDALVNFFPKGQRDLLEIILKKSRDLRTKAVELAKTKAADPRVDQAIMDKLTSVDILQTIKDLDLNKLGD